MKSLNRVLLASLALLVVILWLSGCSDEEKGGDKPVDINILNDKDFQSALKPYRIDVIAPASKADPSIIEQLKAFKKNGLYDFYIPDNLQSDETMPGHIPYHANTDSERLAQLKAALLDPNPNTIVWLLRGGYGSARLIDGLLKEPVPKTKKIFIGFSDATALHLFLSQHWGWHTIHGAGLANLFNPKQDLENFKRIAEILKGSKTALKFKPLMPINEQAHSVQKISGIVTGGNLALIQTSVGTPWQIKTEGKILFLEETGEKGYQLDRALNHLKQAGLLKGVKAIVLGNFSMPASKNLDEAALKVENQIIDTALKRFAEGVDIPVFKNDQFGHDVVNYPIVYNAMSDITINKESKTFDWTIFI